MYAPIGIMYKVALICLSPQKSVQSFHRSVQPFHTFLAGAQYLSNIAP